MIDEALWNSRLAALQPGDEVLTSYFPNIRYSDPPALEMFSEEMHVSHPLTYERFKKDAGRRWRVGEGDFHLQKPWDGSTPFPLARVIIVRKNVPDWDVTHPTINSTIMMPKRHFDGHDRGINYAQAAGLKHDDMCFWNTNTAFIFFPVKGGKKLVDQDYPHTCPLCSKKAYIGFTHIECVGIGCRNYATRKP